MGLSITAIALENKDFILRVLEKYERELHPSSAEDEEIVRRAVFSVRNKSVLFERYNPTASKLYTVVQDVRPAEVMIDFHYNGVQCTCPQKLCRHQLGVMLGLYQHFGSVQDWAANWRAKKNVQLNQLAAERSPESWQRMVDEVMGHILQSNRRIESYVVTSIIESAHGKLRRYMPYEREWQPLFKLFIELAVLNKLWAHCIKTDSPMTSEYFHYAIDKRYDYGADVMDELGTRSRLFATDPFYDALQEQVRQLLLQGKGLLQYRLKFYLRCWDTIFNERQRASQELEILQGTLPDIEFPIKIIELIFHIKLKNREAIVENVQHVDANQIQIYEAIVHFALNQNDEQSATLILKAMLPHLPYYINEVLVPHQRQMFVRQLNTLYTEVELNDEEEMLLYGAFGRYGIQPYSDFLLRRERYDEWVALHHLYPSSISHLEACGLKQVLKVNPGVLLPLYHHYAMEEVRQKSRMNYKQATRIWKSMKSAAKKAGKVQYFDDYIETVRGQFKRLRALQEELEKANLLS
ncbi:hypothetical protein [Lysinibacillus sp. 54212]|uniref:hypothetical protein n=1 Tax=Lysinibacillus sp. 54212 TaxID=3119829 RepID=UPI002FCBD04A